MVFVLAVQKKVRCSTVKMTKITIPHSRTWLFIEWTSSTSTHFRELAPSYSRNGATKVWPREHFTQPLTMASQRFRLLWIHPSAEVIYLHCEYCEYSIEPVTNVSQIDESQMPSHCFGSSEWSVMLKWSQLSCRLISLSVFWLKQSTWAQNSTFIDVFFPGAADHLTRLSKLQVRNQYTLHMWPERLTSLFIFLSMEIPRFSIFQGLPGRSSRNISIAKKTQPKIVWWTLCMKSVDQNLNAKTS